MLRVLAVFWQPKISHRVCLQPTCLKVTAAVAADHSRRTSWQSAHAGRRCLARQSEAGQAAQRKASKGV